MASWFSTPQIAFRYSESKLFKSPVHFYDFHRNHQLVTRNCNFRRCRRIFCNSNDTDSNQPQRNGIQLYNEIERFVLGINFDAHFSAIPFFLSELAQDFSVTLGEYLILLLNNLIFISCFTFMEYNTIYSKLYHIEFDCLSIPIFCCLQGLFFG